MSEEYGTAGYLAEPHPDDPVQHPLLLWVEVAFCKRCGAVVHYKDVHDAWHRSATEIDRSKRNEPEEK